MIDFAGVTIGTVDDDGGVNDFAGVRFGALPKDDIIDFAGVRVGNPRRPVARSGRGHPPRVIGLTTFSVGMIGLQMLPVLEPLPGLSERAAVHARLLGEAFQMSNFIRDVGEDLDRGRTYLPDDAQAAAGVTRAELFETRRTGEVTPGVRALLRARGAKRPWRPSCRTSGSGCTQPGPSPPRAAAGW